MLNQNTNANQIELSDEQLEIVAGGVAIDALDTSSFKQVNQGRLVATSAGGNGATTVSKTFNDSTASLGASGLKVVGLPN